MKMVLLEYGAIYLLGAMGYGALEILWRGHTHWTMLLTGGLCLSLIYCIAANSREKLWKQWIMSAAVITTAEFVVGCIVNLHLGWNVWDYSDRPFHLLGQICPTFFLIWLGISVFAVGGCRWLKRALFEKLRTRPQKGI